MLAESGSRGVLMLAVVGLMLAGSIGLDRSTQVANEDQKLAASDAEAADVFGCSVAIEGGSALIGAYMEDEAGQQAGAAYVFQRDGTGWLESQKLVPSVCGEWDFFGWRVALSGDTAVFGAYGDNDYTGYACVYRHDGSQWIEEAILTASDGAEGDLFGHSLDVSGDVAIVGASADDDNGSDSGSAYVYRFDGSEWIEEQKLTASDGAEADWFGCAVGVCGDMAVIGACRCDSAGADSGQAYVYRFNGTVWEEEAKLQPGDCAVDDNFGSTVSVQDDVALIGSPYDNNVHTNAGAAYVFRFNGADWVEESKLLASDGAEGDCFGYSVSLTVDGAAVGAFRDGDYGEYSGSAYFFRYCDSTWIEKAKLLPSDGMAGAEFGVGVATDGSAILVGAHQDCEGAQYSGSAYVFERPGTEENPIEVLADGSGDFDTIQDAIDWACDGDFIVAGDGAYTGPGNRDITFAGKAITVRSENGPDNCIIDCQDLSRGIAFENGETEASILDGFTITRAFTDGEDGAAIICMESSPTIINCVLKENLSESGPGLTCDVGSPHISNCVFADNEAEEGGGISAYDSTPTIIDCTFTGNEAGIVGAAIHCRGSDATIIGCTIADNHATGSYAGGISCSGGSSATIINCTIANNTSNTVGGGIACLDGSDTSIINCRITDNETPYDGGAVYVFDSDVDIIGCTVSRNVSAVWSAAVFIDGGTTTIADCILWEDVSPNEITVVAGSAVVSYCDVQGGYTGDGNMNDDPLFVDPDGLDDDPATWEDNDYRLTGGSPCIDAGDNTAVPVDIATDLDGNPRFVDDPDTEDTGFGDPPIVDMGAYEFQPDTCPADLNDDGKVNIDDLFIILGAWGPCDDPSDCPEDLNGDGKVNIDDLFIILGEWGPCP